MKWLWLTFFLCVLAIVAVDQARGHDGYRSWMRPDVPGVSCCNEQDCAPLEPGQSYIEGGQYWITIMGPKGPVNCPVPQSKILDATKLESIPPGNGHACVLPNMWLPTCDRLLCYLPGVGG